MNTSIVQYFKSPKADESKDDAKSTGKDEVSVNECSHAVSLEPEPGPSQPSKSEVDRMIAENMASVLKSLKKKRNHKCSRRRKNGEYRDGKEGKEKGSPRKESKETSKEIEDEPTEESSKQPKDDKGNKVNAFQLMMSSRNKAIGSNSPGKNASENEELNHEQRQKRDEKIKRKIKLEEWADKKGAGKRKLQEAAEEEFIAHQMNRRAKRMKKLLKNMGPEDADDSVVVVVESPKTESRKPKQRKGPEPVVKLKVKAKRGRPRLSSEDSMQSNKEAGVALEKTPKKESIVDDFIGKLNSPLKKRDSLLGYFDKVISPKSTTEEETPTANRRSRGRGRPPVALSEANTIEVIVPLEEKNDLQDETDGTPNTPASSGRPRRQCANKVKDYAVFGGTSPEKEAAASKRSSRKSAITPLKMVNVDAQQSTSVVQDPPGTPKTTKNVKLAPLFVKKPVEDPEKVRARQEFLMSGIPEKMRLEIEKQRIYEDSILNESPVFPLISHVQQLVFPTAEKRLSLKSSKVRILAESPGRPVVERDEDAYAFCSLTDCDDTEVEEILAKLVDQGDTDKLYSYDLPDVANVKSIIREWKQTYRHFPVFKCYRQFRDMYEEHVEIGSPPRRLCPKPIDEDSIELIEEHVPNLNGELLFTEKYKPLNSDNILVNCQPAIALKKFLSGWKENRSSNPCDSDDDFEGSNSSVSSNSTSMCNHVVLVGPPGCGKTCNVYAVANEMNYNVLELNASSRRKGKIILQELQEATQSHQVRRKDETGDIFKKVLSRKGSKSKLRKISTDSDPGSSKKLSLILVEDADIVFEQDDGFVAAINQLIATSKRPIVLTTTDPNCAHLSRYISNNVIRYVAPGIANVAKLLSILSIVEKVHIDQQDLARLYALNRKDFRKTVNELHFFIQSGGDRDQSSHTSTVADEPGVLLVHESDGIQSQLTDDEASRLSTASSTHSEAAVSRKHRSLFRLFSRNQNDRQQLIRMPLDFDNLWCNMEPVFRTAPATVSNGGVKRRKKTAKVSNRSQQELDELVFFYQNISTAALIQRDSKSTEDRLVHHLEEEVAHGLVEDSWERWFEGDLEEAVQQKRRSGVGAMCYDSLKQFDTDGRQLISSHIGINAIRTRSTYCDYEPVLRTICRYERERSKAERRGSRFYHYFRNFQYASLSTGGTSGNLPTNFSVDYFDELSTRFEVEHIPTTISAIKVRTESSDESR
ncbi:enhanced level of genomic instability 1 [Malaya genurostris]|uniref:enhanced level of genomic instability 1 n=1 Tax=Malaya genurostris TaxID=325434 RepID=UPI0026F3C0E7|nr:enhanced level of genomic instability 1 [Malaya genurostris]